MLQPRVGFCFLLFLCSASVNSSDDPRALIGVISPPNIATVQAQDLTDKYTELLILAQSRASGDNSDFDIQVEEIFTVSSNPLATVLLSFNAQYTAADVLAVLSRVSTADATQIFGYPVITIAEDASVPLVEYKTSMNSNLWILAVVIIPSFLIASAIAVICCLMQPDTGESMNKTAGNVFRQQNVPWTMSGTKVARLRDRNQENVHDNVAFSAHSEAAVERKGKLPRRAQKKHKPEDPVQTVDVSSANPDVNEPAVETHDESTCSDCSVPSAEMVQTQPVVSKEPDMYELDPLSLTAPGRLFSPGDGSMFSLWSYYRALDESGTVKRHPDEMPDKLPSHFSHTLQYTHPLLLRSPERAIMQETGAAPPDMKPVVFVGDSELDDLSVTGEQFCLTNLGLTHSAQVRSGGGYKPGVTELDEIDVAASTRFSRSSDSATFRRMQAEMRRIYAGGSHPTA